MTLPPGSSMTISGTVISAAADGTALVVGSSTVELAGAPTPTTSVGAGNYVWNGLGGGKDTAATGDARAERLSAARWTGMLGSLVSFGVFVVVLL